MFCFFSAACWCFTVYFFTFTRSFAALPNGAENFKFVESGAAQAALACCFVSSSKPTMNAGFTVDIL
jgi:hypothetical protein